MHAEIVVLLIKPFVFAAFPFPSPSSELKVPNVAYRVFSHDVTAVILVSPNNETAAMSVSQTNPLRVVVLCKCFLLF